MSVIKIAQNAFKKRFSYVNEVSYLTSAKRVYLEPFRMRIAYDMGEPCLLRCNNDTSVCCVSCGCGYTCDSVYVYEAYQVNRREIVKTPIDPAFFVGACTSKDPCVCGNVGERAQ